MAKLPCKSLRKDGQPCQGHGHPDLDGYCIAHAAPEKVWEWRSRGGKASSTAARADKRIPERPRGAIEKVTQGMEDLLEEKIEPLALSAISRSARVLIDLYRLADEEMDQIRGEEDAVTVAQVAADGTGPNPFRQVVPIGLLDPDPYPPQTPQPSLSAAAANRPFAVMHRIFFCPDLS